jgi:hypothetical protein
MSAVVFGAQSWETGKRAHIGTAGAMLDRSLAAGLAPMLSSFSRMDFSVETMRRDVIAVWYWVPFPLFVTSCKNFVAAIPAQETVIRV